jgi:hypothetical protein
MELQRVLPRQPLPLLGCFFLMLLPAQGFAQPVSSEVTKFEASIDASALALGTHQRFKGNPPEHHKRLAEFVAGNMLFVLLHEMGHTAVTEMGLPVLGKEEDAADSFAATRLIRIESGVSDRVLTEAAQGWFMSDRRDKKQGDPVPYYDRHGLDLVRAYQIVCFMVGADKDRFKALATEAKLPEDRQDSCAGDYHSAANAWDFVLKPHLRAADQPKAKIDVTYGEAEGDLAIHAQAFRSIQILEIVARHAADQFAWPSPFTMEMQSCGFINARWVASTHKLTLCYELAADFADLYHDYGAARIR